MSFQAPARSRRAKASSESFAGMIVGSFIVAALAEEWRVAALSASQSGKSEPGELGGEDAFTFGRDGVRPVSHLDTGVSTFHDRVSVPSLDGVADAASASDFDGLSPDGVAAAGFEREDAAGVVAHHQAGWLFTHA